MSRRGHGEMLHLEGVALDQNLDDAAAMTDVPVTLVAQQARRCLGGDRRHLLQGDLGLGRGEPVVTMRQKSSHSRR